MFRISIVYLSHQLFFILWLTSNSSDMELVRGIRSPLIRVKICRVQFDQDTTGEQTRMFDTGNNGF